MLNNSNNLLRKAIGVFITYLILVVIVSIVSWAVINGVFARLSTVPEVTRRGYENPFLSYVGMALVNLCMTIVTYKLAIALIPKTSRNTTIKIIIGVIAGILPITIMYSVTYGIPYSRLPDLVYILILAIAGGFIPIIEKRIVYYLESK